MRKFKVMALTVLCVIVLAVQCALLTNATISLQQSGWNPTPKNADNATDEINLAKMSGVTVTGDEWASGQNRGLASLVDGVTVPVTGESQGWIIDYGTQQSKSSVDFKITFPSPQKVSMAAIYASFEHVGYGLPGLFQIVGTLADDSTVVLYDHSAYELIPQGGYHNGYVFRFAPTTVKAVTMKCIAPYTGYTDGKAMPDSNVAYWITECMLFNDTDRNQPIDITASDNLALRSTITSTMSKYFQDRPVTDLTDGAAQSPYFGGYLLQQAHLDDSGVSSSNPIKLMFQYPSLTTINNVTVYGREAEANSGVMKDYRIKAYKADGTETILYDTSNAAAYPNVTVTAAAANTPLSISFPRTTASRVVLEIWGFHQSADSGILCWMNEVQMFNKNGATAITVNKSSLNMQTSGSSQTASVEATLTPGTAQTLVWATSDSSVATVSNGTVTAVGVGTCNITVSVADDPTLIKVIPVTVVESIVPVSGISLNKEALTIKVNASDNTLQATVNPDNATTKTVEWSSSDGNIATVENGVVRGIAPGTATITVKSTVDSSKSASCVVTVEKIAVTGVTVTPAQVSLDVRATQTLQAAIAPENASYQGIKWESENEEIAAVDANTGVVTALKGGLSCKIYAVSTDDQTIKGYCTVTVNGIPAEELYLYKDSNFEEEADSLTVKAGEKLTVYPYFNPSDATTRDLIWTSSDSKIATVDNGVITGVAKGDVTIRAAVSANKEVYAEFTLHVTPADKSSETTKPDSTPSTGTTIPVLPLIALTMSSAFVAVVGKKKR